MSSVRWPSKLRRKLAAADGVGARAAAESSDRSRWAEELRTLSFSPKRQRKQIELLTQNVANCNVRLVSFGADVDVSSQTCFLLACSWTYAGTLTFKEVSLVAEGP